MSEVIITKDNAPTAIVTLENGQQITVNIGGSGAAAAENGIPAGGDTGQILAKSSADDFAAAWVDPPVDGADGADGVGVPTGGTTGQVLAKAADADFETAWVDPAAGGGGEILRDLSSVFPRAGSMLSNVLNNSNGAIGTQTADRLRLSGLMLDREVTVSAVGLRFSAAGAKGRVAIYRQTAVGSNLADLIYEGGDLIAAPAYVSETASITFDAGVLYLIGGIVDANISMALHGSSSYGTGVPSGTSTATAGCVSIVHSYANTLPSQVDFLSAVATGSVVPIVNMPFAV